MAKHLWGVSKPVSLKALRFPSNESGSDTAAPYAVIQYDNPELNGLPIWGPSGAGITLFRRIKFYQQTGYHAGFWYTDRSTTFADTSPGYWGFHPYPTTATNAGTSHNHEVATDFGGDYLDTRVGIGNRAPVVKNTWLIQALRITRNNASSKTFTFYTNLPSVANADVVEATVTSSSYGETPTPNPRLTIGDSPWYAGFQHERLSGDLAEQMIIAKSMSQSDVVTQGNSLRTLATADSIANIWWGKKTYSSIDDLTCDYGTGRAWVRNDSSNLITLVDAT